MRGRGVLNVFDSLSNISSIAYCATYNRGDRGQLKTPWAARFPWGEEVFLCLFVLACLFGCAVMRLEDSRH